MNQTVLNTVRIRLLWYPQAQFAGYLLAQDRGLARGAGIEIDCVPLDFAKGPIEALLDGDVRFAVASPSHMLESGRANELVFLAAIQQTSSLVYPARKSAGIRHPGDLAGHNVGIWPGREDLELRWMLHLSGLAATDYRSMPVKDTVEAMMSGAVDCAQMTSYHEVHHLEHQAGSLGDFILFRAADFGASLLKDGLIARRDWVDAHRAETQAVIDASLCGWTEAFRNPNVAIDLCARLRPDMSRAEHAQQLDDIRALSITGATQISGLGFPDSIHMLQAVRAMREIENMNSFKAGDLVDDSFWRAAPADSRSTAW
jgi:NitT/TauT family transport system substrate-binding protein